MKKLIFVLILIGLIACVKQQQKPDCGCIDPTADNYQSGINCGDGSCQFDGSIVFYSHIDKYYDLFWNKNGTGWHSASPYRGGQGNGGGNGVYSEHPTDCNSPFAYEWQLGRGNYQYMVMDGFDKDTLVKPISFVVTPGFCQLVNLQ
jgi:hypothetical protein